MGKKKKRTVSDTNRFETQEQSGSVHTDATVDSFSEETTYHQTTAFSPPLSALEQLSRVDGSNRKIRKPKSVEFNLEEEANQTPALSTDVRKKRAQQHMEACQF